MKALVLALSVGALSLIPATSQAGHAPNSYCSESGDVCASARKIDGKRLLKIATAAEYFETYKVCVTAPDDSKVCRRGTMRDGDGDGIFVGKMSWAKRFPNKGPGAYSVRWTADGFRTDRLGFHKN